MPTCAAAHPHNTSVMLAYIIQFVRSRGKMLQTSIRVECQQRSPLMRAADGGSLPSTTQEIFLKSRLHICTNLCW
eukprot:1161214-Pelagomonas_calceolata.AAC.14